MQVTMVSNNDLEHPKIKHFRHGLREFDVDSYNMFELGRNPDVLFKKFEVIFPVIASKIYNDPVVKDLYSRRKEFDLIVINGIFNNVRNYIKKIYKLFSPWLTARNSSSTLHPHRTPWWSA